MAMFVVVSLLVDAAGAGDGDGDATAGSGAGSGDDNVAADAASAGFD
jgi:hypothetical protein